jgi:nitrogen regulatory protein PII
MESNRNLIITVVKKGWGDVVLKASIKAGADGGTILTGRGIGVHEQQTILGISIEPEKEVVYSVTQPQKTDAILDAIKTAAELDKPGNGLAFVVPVSRVIGIVHEESDPPAGSVEDSGFILTA